MGDLIDSIVGELDSGRVAFGPFNLLAGEVLSHPPGGGDVFK